MRNVSPTRRRSPARGVTLIEVLVVVTIIGIFVALAGPSIVSTMGDRHAARGADEVSGLYRRARVRAASYGAAHLVRVSASGSTLKFELRMAIDPGTGFPVSSCMASPWAVSGVDNRVIDTVDFDGGSYAGRQVRAVGAVGDLCITPGGQVFTRTSGLWAQPGGETHVDFRIERYDDSGAVFGIVRTIRVGVGGAPHLEVTG